MASANKPKVKGQENEKAKIVAIDYGLFIKEKDFKALEKEDLHISKQDCRLFLLGSQKSIKDYSAKKKRGMGGWCEGDICIEAEPTELQMIASQINEFESLGDKMPLYKVFYPQASTSELWQKWSYISKESAAKTRKNSTAVMEKELGAHRYTFDEETCDMYDEEDEAEEIYPPELFPDADLPNLFEVEFSEVFVRQIYSIKKIDVFLKEYLWPLARGKYIEDTICEKVSKDCHLFCTPTPKIGDMVISWRFMPSCYRDVGGYFTLTYKIFFDFYCPIWLKVPFNIERDYSLLEQVIPQMIGTKALPELPDLAKLGYIVPRFQKQTIFNEKFTHSLELKPVFQDEMDELYGIFRKCCRSDYICRWSFEPHMLNGEQLKRAEQLLPLSFCLLPVLNATLPDYSLHVRRKPQNVRIYYEKCDSALLNQSMEKSGLLKSHATELQAKICTSLKNVLFFGRSGTGKTHTSVYSLVSRQTTISAITKKLTQKSPQPASDGLKSIFITASLLLAKEVKAQYEVTMKNVYSSNTTTQPLVLTEDLILKELNAAALRSRELPRTFLDSDISWPLFLSHSEFIAILYNTFLNISSDFKQMEQRVKIDANDDGNITINRR